MILINDERSIIEQCVSEIRIGICSTQGQRPASLLRQPARANDVSPTFGQPDGSVESPVDGQLAPVVIDRRPVAEMSAAENQVPGGRVEDLRRAAVAHAVGSNKRN